MSHTRITARASLPAQDMTDSHAATPGLAAAAQRFARLLRLARGLVHAVGRIGRKPLLAAAAACLPLAGFAQTTYSTAGSFSYTVPAGMTQIGFQVTGAGGGGGGIDSSVPAGAGGLAGTVIGYIPVTPGESLTIRVGGGGGVGGSGNCTTAVVGTAGAGWMAGGTGGRPGCVGGSGTGGGGGGASAILRGATLLVAAGGGGGGGGGAGGATNLAGGNATGPGAGSGSAGADGGDLASGDGGGGGGGGGGCIGGTGGGAHLDSVAATVASTGGSSCAAGTVQSPVYGTQAGSGGAGGQVPLPISTSGATGKVVFFDTSTYWDVSPQNNGAVNGGAGTWQAAASTSNTNWTDSAGTANTRWMGGGTAVFSGVAGTVTVDNSLGAVNIGGMTFNTNGYVINDGTVNGAAANTVLTTGTISADGTINSILSGGAFEKLGLGRVVLNGANTFTGVMKVTAGDLLIGNAASLGTTAANTQVGPGGSLSLYSATSFPSEPVLLNGGILRSLAAAVSIDYGGPITLGADSYIQASSSNGNSLTISGGVATGGFTARLGGAVASSTLYASGVISGTGAILKEGTNVAQLGAANTYSGTTTVNSGTLSFTTSACTTDAAGALSRSSSLIVNNGGTASVGGCNSLYGDSATGAAPTVTLNTGGTLTMADGVTQNFKGTTLQLAGGTLSSTTAPSGPSGSWVFHPNSLGQAASVNVTENSTISATKMRFVQSNTDFTVASGKTLTVSGTMGYAGTGTNLGGLTKKGPGEMVLSGDNLYTGTTSVNEGTLTIAGTYASASHVIASGAVLELDATSGLKDYATTTFSGSGTLRKTGSNTVQWGGTLGTFALGSGALIDVQQGNFLASTNSNEVWTNNRASLNVAAGAAFTTVEGAPRVDKLTGAGSISSGYFSAVNPNSGLTVGVDGGSATFSGVIADGPSITAAAKSFTKEGTGTQTLSGANTYSGLTTISDGTLVAAHATALGTTVGATTVASGVSLALPGGIAVGAEALTLNGAGVSSAGALYNVTGANSHAGAITLGSASSIGSTTGTLTLSGAIANGANTLTLTGAGNIVANGVIGGGAGGLTKSGAGTATLGAANTYTGATTISAGVLKLGINGALPSTSALTIAAGGQLSLDGKSQTVSSLSNSGSIDLGVGGSLTLASGTHTSNGEILGSGKVTLSSGATLTMAAGISNNNIEVILAGGELRWGAASTSGLGTVTLTANSTMDFSSVGAASLTVAITVNPGTSTLTVNNWTAGSDHFYANGITGTPARNTANITPLNQIKLGSNAASATYWATDNELLAASSYTYWDGPSLNTTTVEGGAGTWGGNLNWTSSTGAGRGVWSSGSIATFAGTAGTAGTVSVSGAQDIGGLTFNIPNYVLEGSTLTSTTATAAIYLDSGAATIRNTLAGTGAFEKTGAGQINLGDAAVGGGNNTFTGAMAIKAGTLRIAHSNGLGTAAAGTTVDSGATLAVFNGVSSAEPLTINGIGAAGTGAIFASSTAPNTLTGVISLASNSRIQVTSPGSLVLSGVVSGASALEKTGTGMLVLGNRNTYSGTTTVNGGTLSFTPVTCTVGLTGALSRGSSLIINNGGTASVDACNAMYGDNTAGAAPSITINTGGLLTLSNGAMQNLQGVTINLAGGELASSAAPDPATGSWNFTNDDSTAIASLNVTENSTVSASKMRLQRTPNFTVASGKTLSVTGTFGGHTAIKTGGFNKLGAGTITLSGANSYTGATTIAAGTAIAAHNTALGTVAGGVSVTSGASLGLQSGIAIGAETLTLNGAGVSSAGALYNVTGANSHAGAITLGSASSIGSTTGTLTLTGVITNGANALTMTGAGNIVANGVIGGGAGGLTKSGAGTLTLGAANTYTGATSITAGTVMLAINGALPAASATTVSSGATLDLEGRTQTLNSLTNSGKIDLGTGGTLTLASGTHSSTGNITGSGTIILNTGATLTLTSALSNSGVNITLAGGTLNLGAFTHSIATLGLTANNTLDFASGNAQITAATFTPSTFTLAATNWTAGSDHFYATAITGAPARNTANVAPLNQVTLGSNAASATYWATTNELLTAAAYTYWDGLSADTTTVEGGTGTWTSGALNWTASTGAGRGIWSSGAVATFDGATANVTVSGTQDIGGLTVNATGDSLLSGGVLNGTAVNNIITVNGASNNTYIASTVSGGAFEKQGAGTLRLTNANTYTGITKVSAGQLMVGHANALGSTSASTQVMAGAFLSLYGTSTFASEPITLSGGVLRTTSAIAIAFGGPITLSADSYIQANSTSSTFTLSGGIATAGFTARLGGTSPLDVTGAVSGTGAVLKEDANAASLSAVNTYSGATSVNAGTLTLGINGAIPQASTTTVAAGAALDIDGRTQTLNRLVNSGTLDLGTGGTLTLTSGAHTSTGAITGSGTIILNTGASLTLTSALNNASVSIRLAGGTLNLGAFTHTLGTLNLTANSTLDFASAGNAQITAATFTPSTFTMTATNWIAGSDRFYATAITGAPAKNTVNIAPLNQVTLGGNAASVTYWATDNEVIAASSYSYWDGPSTNTTTVEGGTGIWGANLNWTASTGVGRGLWNQGSVANFGGAAGTATVSGTQNIGGLNFSVTGYTLTGGTLNGTSVTNVITAATGLEATVTSVVSGTSTFAKEGAGGLILDGANTFIGAMNINAGWITIKNATALGTSAGGTSVASGASLVLQHVTGITVSGEALSMAGTNALRSAGGANTWAGTVALAADSSIQVDSSTMTISGAISGSGGLFKNGAGNLALSGSNTYTGSTTVSAGTLTLAVNGAIPQASTTTVAAGAALDIDGRTQTLNRLVNSGTLDLGTGGTLTLTSGAHTSTGAITGSGTIILNTGASLTLTSALNNASVNITLAGGTLNLGAFTHTLGTLSTTANSTLDFASAGAAQITAATLTLGASNTLAVTNWTSGSDHFYATAITGAPARDTGNIAPLNRISFGSLPATYTQWRTAANEVMPFANFVYWDGGDTTPDGTADGGPGNWTAAGTNWTSAAGDINGVFAQGSVAIFGGASGSVNVTGTQTIAGLTFSTTNYSLSNGVLNGTSATNVLTSSVDGATYSDAPTISSVLSGGAYEKRGTGSIRLILAANNYTGLTTVSQGTLILGHADALGTTAAGTTVASGATVVFYNAPTFSAEPMTLSGGTLQSGTAFNVTFPGAITLTANSFLSAPAGGGVFTLSGTIATGGFQATLGGASSVSVTGVISGAGGVTKQDAGSATLGAVNTYTGATSVAGGTLTLGINSALPQAGTATVAVGAVLDINGKTQTLNRLANSGTLALGTGGSLTLASGTHSSTGAITGSGTITLNTGASLTLTSALANSGVNIVLNGGTLNLGAFTHSMNTLSLAANSTLDFASGNAQFTAATFTPSTFTLAASNWTGGSDHFYATAITGAPARNTANIAPLNQVTLGSNAASITYWATDNELVVASNYTYWDGLSADTTTIEGGAGTWTAGGLNWTSSTGAGRGIWNTGSVAMFQATAGTVNVSGTQDIGGLTDASGYTFSGGTLNMTAVISTVTINATATSIQSVLAGGAGNAIVKEGTGQLNLNAANTFAGAFTVRAGAIVVSNNSSLGGTGGATTVESGGIIFLPSTGLTVAEPLTLNGTGGGFGALANYLGANTWSGPITLATDSTVRVNASTATLTITGSVGGTGALTKTGAGTLMVSGSNSHGGATTVSAGVLNANHPNALGTAAGGTTVSSGGTLLIAASNAIASEALSISGTGSEAAGGLYGALRGNIASSYGGNITLAGSAVIGSYGLTVGGSVATAGNTLTLSTLGPDTNTLDMNGVISGTGRIVAGNNGGTANTPGIGLVRLNAVNTYSGTTGVTGGTLRLGVNSAIPQTSTTTVAVGATLSINGRTQTLNSLANGGTLDLGAGGVLTLASGTHSSTGAITGSGTIIVNTGATLTLTSLLNNANVNIALAGGTLNLGAFTHTMGTLGLTANSTLDFASGNAQLTAATFTPGTFTLAATNWTAGLDHFYATAITGAPARNTANITPLNQVTLGSNAASATYWATDNELIAASNFSYWDGPSANTTAIEGGTGIWSSGGLNWTASTGAGRGIWNAGTVANFGGTPGTVSVTGAQDITGLTFGVTGYTVGGGSLNGTAATNVLTTGTGVNATVTSVLTGGGNAFTKAGAGTLVLTGQNTYTGLTTVDAGLLLVSTPAGLQGVLPKSNSLVINNATLRAVSANALYGEGAAPSPGTITINSGGVLTTSDNLEQTHYQNITLAGGSITGLAPANVWGTWIFIGNSINVTADSTISAQRVSLYRDNTNFTVASGATLTMSGTFMSAPALATGEAAPGTGGLTKLGAGTMVMSGANTNAGPTVVSAGRLLVNGSQPTATGAVSVASGATLGGMGTLGGAVTVAAGGILEPGASGGTGTMTVAGLSLNNTSVLNYQLGLAGTVGGALNDLVQDNGNLTLDGTLNIAVSPGGTFGPGVYRLMNYTGTLANNTLVIGSVPGGVNAADLRIDTSVTGQVNLVYGGSGYTYWDAGTKNNGVVDGGSGTWQGGVGNNNWTLSTGATNSSWYDGGTATFSGTAGTVTVDVSAGPVNVGGLVFSTNNYAVAGNALNGSAVNTQITVSSAPFEILINSVLSGGAFEKLGPGRLFLHGANTFTGIMKVTAGDLVIGHPNALGTTAGNTQVGAGANLTLYLATTFPSEPLALNGGTLRSLASAVSIDYGGPITLGADSYISAQSTNGNTLTISGGIATGGFTARLGGNATSTLYANSVIGGTGAILKEGSNAAVLGAVNTFTGATSINAGTLQFSVNGAIPQASTTTVAAGAVLDLNGRTQTLNSLANSGTLALGTGGVLTLGSGTHSSTGAITGSGTIIVNTGATLTLTSALANANVNITLAGGTLNLGAFTHSMGTLNVTANSTLDFASAGAAQITAATLTLGASNTLAATNWTSGSDHFIATAITGAPAKDTGNIAPLNRISFNSAPASYTQWRTTGSEIMPVGTFVYWDGGDTAADGTVDGGSGNWTAAGTNWTTATGDLNGAFTQGSVAIFGATAGTVSVTGTQTIAGLTFNTANYLVQGGVLDGTATPNILTSTVNGATYNDAPAITSVLSGGAYEKRGTGTIRLLLAANTYTGLTTVSQGTLLVGHANALGSTAAGTLVEPGASIVFYNVPTFAAEPVTLNGGSLQSGTGAGVTFPGAVTLSADSAMSALSGGSLTLSGGIATAGFRATLAGAGAVNVTGAVSGAGGITKQDANTATLGAVNTYSGATSVAGGTLTLGINSALPQASTTTVAASATLAIDGRTQTLNSLTNTGALSMGGGTLTLASGTHSSSGSITGNGAIVLNTGATLTLTGPVSNSGLNIVLAGGTLNLGAFTHSMNTLSLAANSTLDFASGNAQLTAATLAPSTFTLTATNWTAGSDHFYATAITGAPAKNTANIAPLNQVKLGAAAASATYWASDNELLVASSHTYWDGPSADTTTVEGGAGIWGSGINWTASNGAGRGIWNAGAVANFGGAAGTVTVSGTQDIGGLNFSVTGYTVAGGALNGTSVTNVITAGTGVNATVTSVLSGSNAFAKDGAGSLVLSGANTFTGALNVNAGVIIAGSASVFGTSAGGTVVASGAALVLQDAGGFTVSGEALSLGGTHPQGALRSTSGANTWAGTVALAANSNIQVDATTLTLSGVVSGAGGLAKTGSGTLLFSAANTYAGTTSVNAGTLQFSVNGALPQASTTTVAAGAALDLDGRTQTLNSLANSGTLDLGTGGTLTLANGTHSSTGAIIGSGTITLDTGASLTLTSALANSGVNIVLNGGTLNLGAFTHSMGTLSVTANSTLDFASAGAAQLTAATLTLGASNTLAVANWTGGSDHFHATAITSAPAKDTGNIAPLNRISFGSTPASYTQWRTAGNELMPMASFVYWDGGDSAADGTVDGGTGNWTAAGTNWTSATGDFNGAFTQDGMAIFGAPAGTVTVTGNQNIGGMTFNAKGYTVNSGTLTGTTATTVITNADPVAPADVSIGSVLAGASGVTFKFTGPGDGRGFTLAGNNTYSGPTVLEAGSLYLSHNNALGASTSGTTVMDGATLSLTDAGGLTVSEPLTLNGLGMYGGAGHGALANATGSNTWSGTVNLNTASRIVVGSAASLALSGAVSGSGGLDKTGLGTLTLSGANTFTGTATVSVGTVLAGNAAALGTAAGATSVSSGASLALQGGIAIGAEALTLNGTGVSSAGALYNASGANSHAGAITLGSAASIGSTTGTLTLSGAVANGANTLTMTGAGNITANGVIGSGAGGLAKSGTGILILGAVNTYTGATSVSAGTVQLGVNGAIASASATTVSSGATLAINGRTQTLNSLTSTGTLSLGGGTLTLASGTHSSSGSISGNGTIVLNTGATLTLTGPVSNSGLNIVLAGGTLNLGAFTHDMNTLSLAANSTLDFASAGNAQITAATFAPGTFTLAATSWTAGNDHFYATAITGAPAKNTANIAPLNQVTLGSNAASATFWATDNELVVAPSYTYWDGPSANTTTVEGGMGTWTNGSLNWTGSTGAGRGIWTDGGTAVFTGTGGTVTASLSAGAISIGGMTFSADGYSVTGAALNGTGAPTVLSSSVTGVRPQILSVLSGGAFQKTGAGSLALLGNNSYTGATTISQGDLVIGTLNALGATGAGTTVESGAFLTLNGAALFAAEPLTLNGGTLRMDSSGAATFPGAVTLGANSAIRSSSSSNQAFTVSGGVAAAGYTLTLGGDAPLAVTGVISGAGGSVSKTGTSTATLSAANTYSGVTSVNAGILQLGINGALPQASAITVSSGATLDLNGRTQTLNSLANSGALALGTGGSLTLAAGTHTSGGNITGSGTITLNTGATLTLTSPLVNSSVNIVLNGGTLNLGSFIHSVNTLSLTANSTLDFSSAGNARLTAAQLSLGSNALNVTNWSRGNDHFIATAFTGAARNATNAAPMNQITLAGQLPRYTVWLSSDEISVLVDPRVRIAKISSGGTGSFNFTTTGLSAPSDSIATVASDTPALGAGGITGTIGAGATITESGVPAGWPANPASASCVDANGAVNGNGTGLLGTLTGKVLTIPAANMVAGADLTCTFLNGQRGIMGHVFNDGGAPSPAGTGANTGTPNDGLRNGNETGLSGVTVSLTDCAATTHATVVTDSNGAWSLNVPGTVAAGTDVCVTAGLPTGYLATGANIAGTATPSGAATTVGGTAYTYDRAQQRERFSAPAGGVITMNFGAVPPSTFGVRSSRNGQSGTSVLYSHRFVAGTGGNVAFSITSSVATPAIAGWSERIFADTGCTGVLQAGAAQLYPPAAPLTVVQGQTVCVLVQQFVPGGAQNGNSNTAVAGAVMTFSNAGPALSASYALDDITTVSTTALELAKEVRNVTTGGAYSASNQAKSGDVLEYRITYTNNSAAPMTQVIVSDATPAYSKFISATAGTPPTGLGSCTMNTPVNPLPAPAVPCAPEQTGTGIGPLRWAFDGTLNPGATGQLLFKVSVD